MVGKRELKIHWSKYFKRVESGEVIGVTHRGRPTFYLVPAARLPAGMGGDLAREGVFRRLLDEKFLVQIGGQLSPTGPLIKTVPGHPTVTEILLEDRRAGY